GSFMFDVDKIRNSEHKVLCLGSYPSIIQSMLDFEFTSGKTKPSVVAIIAAGRCFERYFFGKREILIPVFSTLNLLHEKLIREITYVLNLGSGRRVFTTTADAIDTLPSLIGGVVFAENTPEKHAIDLKEYAKSKNVFLLGP